LFHLEKYDRAYIDLLLRMVALGFHSLHLFFTAALKSAMEIDGQQSFTSIWVNSSIIRFCASVTSNALDEINLNHERKGKADFAPKLVHSFHRYGY
jgi:hypothetical protein